MTAEIDGETITGNGSKLSDELTDIISNKRKGIIIFRIKYMAPFKTEKMEIKEIFEFEID